MSIVAGKITAVTGTVQAVNPNTGEVRLLVVGDQVFADEVIITSVTGGVTVDLNNGDLLTLGRNTEMVLDDDVVGLAADSATEGAVDVEALQQALLDGIIDPEDLEATAAGEGDASSANSGGLNVVERLGSEGEVTSGFDTGTRSANDITTREFVGDIVVPVIVSLSGDTSVQEGAAAGYIVSLNDENGNPVVVSQDLTVDFTYSYITAEGEDIVETLSVTVPAGSSSFAFEVNTVDDALAEAPEDFSIAINSITAGAEQFVDISVDDTPVITTITDDTTPNNPPGEEDTVYAVLTGAESVVEGEQATYTVSLVDKDNNPVTLTEGQSCVVEGEQATYTVSLVDKDNNPVTLTEGQSYTVDLSTNSEGLTLAATEGTDYVSLDGDTLTLTGTAAGVSSADFTVSTTDDYLADDGEQYNVAISGASSAAFEGAAVQTGSDSVTTTITDEDVLPDAEDDEFSATESGHEFVASEDSVDTIAGKDDGQSASGNVLANDTTNNGSAVVATVSVAGSTYTLPVNGADETIVTDYGTLTINNMGAFTFDVNETNETVQALNAGDSLPVEFSYVISDGANPASDPAALTINIEGRDDAPVIESVTANDQPLHVVDGLLDSNEDGVLDEVSADDLTVIDKGLIFNAENGDLNINMGDGNSSLAVTYNGGQAGYHNAIGFYTADENGQPLSAQIIYVEDGSMVGSQSEMLGTLNSLSGNVGFFIIPDGGDKGVSLSSQITFDSNGDLLVDGVKKTAYFTDNDLNNDGHDHAVAAMSETNDGIVIGFEDLSLGDRDFDDVVITIQPCVTQEVPSETVLLTEDFEGLNRGEGDRDGGSGWYIDHGDNGNNVLVSDSGIQWTMNDAGIEVRDDNGVHGLDTANDSGHYVELDPDYSGGLDAVLSTNVDVGLNDSFTLTFDMIPRPGAQDSSDMTFSFGGNMVEVNVDSSGNLSFNPADNVVATSTANGWTTITATFDSVVSPAQLTFAGANDGDTLGAYIDNIELVGVDHSTANTILQDVQLSDVDDANLEGATLTLTNFMAGDVISANNLPSGISASINDGVVTLSGSASVATYELALESLTFESSSDDRTPREFEFTVTDGDKTSNTMSVMVDIGGCELNPAEPISPPVADEVRTTSNLDSDAVVLAAFASDSNTPDESQIAFFKKIDIGGGLDGDLNVIENDNNDPADLGGEDQQTAEADLKFDITSLPAYGTVYIETSSGFVALDSTNLNEASTLLSTADSVYWVATHDQVEAGEETQVLGNVFDNGMQSSWESDDVSLYARSTNGEESEITYVSADGIGVNQATGGPSSQLGYDARTGLSESLIMDFKNPVTDAEIAITHLIKGEGEVGHVKAYLDGKEVGSFSFSNVENVADITLTPEKLGNNSAGSNAGTFTLENLVFDQLIFSSESYVNQGSQTSDSSDYFIGGISYHEVSGVEFEYKVIDESDLSSEAVKVQIDVATDTPVPEPLLDNVADAPLLDLDIGSVEVGYPFDTYAYNGDNFMTGSVKQGDGSLKLDNLDTVNETAHYHDDLGFGIQSGTTESEMGIDDNETLLLNLKEPVTSATFNLNLADNGEAKGGWIAFNSAGQQINQAEGTFTITSNNQLTISGIGAFQYVAFVAHVSNGQASDDGFYVDPVSAVNSDNEQISLNSQEAMYPLDISAALTDTDGSESLSDDVTISGLPESGAVSVTGTGVTDNGDGTFRVSLEADGSVADDVKLVSTAGALNEDQLAEIHAAVTSTEASNGDTAVTEVNEEGDHFLYGDDNEAEQFAITADTVIENFGLEQDTLDLSEVIEMDGASINDLSQYLQFESIDTDDDNNNDSTKVTIDSDGDGDANTGTQTEVVIDTVMDNDDTLNIQIDDNNIDYQND